MCDFDCIDPQDVLLNQHAQAIEGLVQAVLTIADTGLFAGDQLTVAREGCGGITFINLGDCCAEGNAIRENLQDDLDGLGFW